LLEDGPGFATRNINNTTHADVGLQVQVFLLFLSSGRNNGSYHTVAQRFGIGKGTVLKHVERVSAAILNLRDRYLSWPSNLNRREFAAQTQSLRF
jgi:hypothetical protein